MVRPGSTATTAKPEIYNRYYTSRAPYGGNRYANTQTTPQQIRLKIMEIYNILVLVSPPGGLATSPCPWRKKKAPLAAYTHSERGPGNEPWPQRNDHQRGSCPANRMFVNLFVQHRCHTDGAILSLFLSLFFFSFSPCTTLFCVVRCTFASYTHTNAPSTPHAALASALVDDR